MKVAVYCRVSTDDQVDARTIENQVDFAVRYCGLHELDIFDFYLDDGISGAVPVEERPGGARLLHDAAAGAFGVVYVYRLDRLARTTLDILKTHQKLSEANVALRSMTENFDTSTPSGKFFMTTLGGIAEIERETISERMRVGKDRAVREGRWPGGPPPYGYSLMDRRLVINEQEAGVVKIIFKLYTRGEMSTSLIAGYLNATGFPAPARSGKKGGGGADRWYASRVWSILSNTVYSGVFIYGRKGKNPITLNCPPVVSVREWGAAEEERKKKALYSRRNSRRKYLLKGLLSCGICGKKFFGDGSGKKERLSYYRCAGNTSFRGSSEKCPSKSVRADILEGVIWNDISTYVLKNRPFIRSIGEKLFIRDELQDVNLSLIDGLIDSKEAEKKRLISLFGKGIVTEDDVRGHLKSINQEMSALILRKSEIFEWSKRQICHLNPEQLIENRLSSASFYERRELVRQLVDDITVDLVYKSEKPTVRVTVHYLFDGFTECNLIIETRGKYRLGLPKSSY
ncbi:MAG: recombinase family protein [Bacillota bacterium]